jgi:cytochrome c peroxidase
MRLHKPYSFLLFLGTIFLSLFLFQCKTNIQTIKPLGEVPAPTENPTTSDKIELGRKLFFDKRLSSDGTVSCATCHIPQFAFTDQKTVSEGVNGGRTQRNSPSILNAGYLPTVMYDAHIKTLELQVIVPIQEHVEMNMKMLDLLKRLKNISEYQEASMRIYKRDFDAYVLTRSISAFERSLISQNSRFDQFLGGNKKSLSKDEIKGWKLFSEVLYCTKCHPAPHFTTYQPENNGLYSNYTNDLGRFRIFNDSNDIGKFKVPSLRNIELTFPYMHDGSLKTIDDVLVHYQSGGQIHPNKSKIIQPFQLNIEQINQVKKFLFSLTDTSYMPQFR